MIAAYAITKLWLTAVNPAGLASRRPKLPAVATLKSMPACPSIDPASPLAAWSRAAASSRRDRNSRREQPPGQEQPKQQRQQQDHQWTADELGQGELPADQQGKDQPEFDHQVGGGELEGHRRGEVRALAKQRPGQRHRRVGARVSSVTADPQTGQDARITDAHRGTGLAGPPP
jgi:hypothetical protein